jgi:hypothetical protein
MATKHFASLVGAAAAAAPADAQQSGQPQQSCEEQGASQYKCEERPGNVQLDDPPAASHYYSVLG